VFLVEPICAVCASALAVAAGIIEEDVESMLGEELCCREAGDLAFADTVEVQDCCAGRSPGADEPAAQGDSLSRFQRDFLVVEPEVGGRKYGRRLAVVLDCPSVGLHEHSRPDDKDDQGNEDHEEDNKDEQECGDRHGQNIASMGE
jgi:hypothetical protein